MWDPRVRETQQSRSDVEDVVDTRAGGKPLKSSWHVLVGGYMEADAWPHTLEVGTLLEKVFQPVVANAPFGGDDRCFLTLMDHDYVRSAARRVFEPLEYLLPDGLFGVECVRRGGEFPGWPNPRVDCLSVHA